MVNELLLGRKEILVEDVADHIQVEGVRLFSGTRIEDVRSVFREETVDIVVMGAGLPIDVRCEIVKEISRLSQTATIHLKDRQSGPGGMLPFVNKVLNGLLGR